MEPWQPVRPMGVRFSAMAEAHLLLLFPHSIPPSLFLLFILFLSSKCYWKLLRNNTFSRQLQKRATRKELEEQKRPKQTKTKENFALPIAYLSARRGGVFTVLARLTGETVGAVTATAAAFNSRHPWRLPAY